MWMTIISFLGGPVIKALIDAYNAKLKAENADAKMDWLSCVIEPPTTLAALPDARPAACPGKEQRCDQANAENAGANNAAEILRHGHVAASDFLLLIDVRRHPVDQPGQHQRRSQDQEPGGGASLLPLGRSTRSPS